MRLFGHRDKSIEERAEDMFFVAIRARHDVQTAEHRLRMLKNEAARLEQEYEQLTGHRLPPPPSPPGPIS